MKNQYLILFVFFFLSLLNIHGQSPYGSNSNLYTSSSFNSKTIDLNKVVGETKGSGIVSNGSFSYSIPVVVAPGTNGISPKINIFYNSMAGNGLLGKGWSFSGPSMIHVGAKNIYFDQAASDIELNSNDAFHLDGKRLIAITGTNGYNDTNYGLEAENYSTIKSFGGSNGNPDYFTVEQKDGTVLEYGKSINERFLHSSSGKTMMWYLSRVRYKDGNYISYHYSKSNNEMLLTSVNYTGNTFTNRAPYNTVTFSYSDQRIDKQKTYLKGQEFNRNSILTEITCRAEGQISRKYKLVYGHNNVNSFLKEIIEYGAGGTSSLNSTIFQYGDTVDAYDLETLSIGGSMLDGDFNGDGLTDKIVITKSLLNQIRTISRIRIFRNLGNGSYSLFYDSGSLGHVYAHNNERTQDRLLHVGDFNGDGYDDILINQVIYYYNGSGAGITGTKLYSGGESGITTSNIPLPQASGPSGTFSYSYIEPNIGSGTYCVTGDFDGDGALDYITIAKRTVLTSDAHDTYYKVFVSYPSKSLYNVPVNVNDSYGYAISPWYESDGYYALNHNADSKSELMIINGANSKIYSLTYNGSSCDVSEIYNSGFPTKWHLILLGDVNNDGLTDILSRTSKTNDSAPWNIAYNKGGSFHETPFSFTGGYPVGSSPQNMEIVDIGDYSGDGKNNLVHLKKYTSYLQIREYHNIGGSMYYSFMNHSDPLCPLSQMPDCTEHLYSSMSSFGKGDYNGDGILDISIGSTGNKRVTALFRPNSDENRLSRIKTGHGSETKVVYDKMTNNIYNKNNWNFNYHDITVRSFPLKLVSELHTDNGTNTSTHKNTYSYEDAYFHRSGKGFLGFGKIKHYNHSKGRYYTTQNKIHSNNMHALLLPFKSITSLDNNNVNILNTSTQNIGIVDKGNRRFFAKTNSILTVNSFAGKTTLQEMLSYDNYGNVTHSKTTINNGLETKETIVDYVQKGTPVPAKPNFVTTKLKRQGQAEYQTKERFLYNNKGQVTYRYYHYGKPKYKREYYRYMPTGVRYRTDTYIPNEQSRSTRVTYDDEGRYVLESYNALDQMVSKVTRDPNTGNILTSTALDNQSMTYTYDPFGRKLTSTYDQSGVSTVHSYEWYQGSDPFTTIYKEVTPGAPDSWIYYDRLGRERKTATTGYNNQLIHTTRNYDVKGRLSNETMPHKSGESVNTHSYVYDIYDRITSKTDVFGASSVSYSYSGGNLTTTSTDPAGKVTTIVTDATGKETSHKDNNNSTVTYTYYSHGELKDVKNGSSILNSIKYDDYLNQIELIDLNAGKTTYTYDGYNRLESQTNANGQTVTNTYDKLDRIVTSTLPEGVTTMLYYPTGSGTSTGKVKEITGFSGTKENFYYDSKARLWKKKYTIDNVEYNYQYYFDNYNNVVRKQFPSNVNIKYQYDASGHLSKVLDHDTNTEIYRAISRNGLGQDTYYRMGNGKYSNQYHHHGIPTRKYTYGVQDLWMNWNYTTMNLNHREDKRKNKKEFFVYDNLDRLKKSYGTGIPTIDINFDNSGNITSKTGVGAYSYHYSKKNAVTRVSSTNSAISSLTQDINYTSFLQPSKLKEGSYQLDYTYAADEQRIKSVLKQNGSPIRTRLYLDEYEINISNSGTEHIHYVTIGDGVKAIIRKLGSTKTTYYTYTDHLGSIVTTTTASGTINAEQNYDAWGKPRNASTWSYSSVATSPSWLFRGYTMHETMPHFRLINMNGRLYDPYVARMLSVDNYAHSGVGLQGYNRYSYAFNNPMKYTDPDGEHPMLIGAAIGFLSNGIGNWINGDNFFDGWVQATFFGAFSGGISFGIGEIAGTIGNSLARGAFQAGAHALSGGFVSELQGGNFWHGAAAGGISSLSGSLIDLSGLQGIDLKAAHWIGGGLSGGVGSAIAGGNFVDGLRQGLITGGLNHAAHQIAGSFQGGPGDPPVKVYIELDGVGHVYVQIGNEIYSYGRYNGSDSPSMGDKGPTGDGVLLKYTGKAAKEFIANRTGKNSTRSYTVSASYKKVLSHFRKLYSSGTANPSGGVVIDRYMLVGNSCVSNCIRGLNSGGANIPITIITPAGLNGYFIDLNLNMIHRD